eukprot:Blabericola_migrator_1__11140@NODE_651_length_7047_cov_201_880372_g477_i0_p3_GENE_NODE_651_length_7047_cov_201_880372_g477_i0NODE_651_length_7047_cov_201_880372_g477_i0_p3_ORF_typecomplete_len442_score61_41Glyco_transf_34/PF05637_12/1_3e05DUF3910/PF13049_6/0_044_NODE_651_length_7047_cov_201_880372_g477_i056196944
MRLGSLFWIVAYTAFGFPPHFIDETLDRGFVEVLSDYAHLDIRALHIPELEPELNVTITVDWLSSRETPLICDTITYTAHSLDRPVEDELDKYRTRWSQQQSIKNCMFLFLLDLANDPRVVPEPVRKAWRARGSPNDPRILTYRYEAGLVLMALIHFEKITTVDGTKPWILYADGDTMFANSKKSVMDIVSRVDRGTAQPTIEQLLCQRVWDISCSDSHPPADSVNEYAIILSVSNNCNQGYHTHSGAFLFQSCRTTAFLFDVLTQSPFHEIDTGRFKMGDQGIWDWLIRNTFQMAWSRLKTLCQVTYRPLTRTACLHDDFLFSRPLTLPLSHLQPHPILRNAQERWFSPVVRSNDTASELLKRTPPTTIEPASIALVCVRWFNSPGCAWTIYKDPLHAFQCGDMVWHTYGCKKESWKHEPLYKMLTSEECKDLAPLEEAS